MKRKFAIVLIPIFTFLFFYSFASAGTILSAYKYAWSNNSGYINFENTTVSDSLLGGYAWSSYHGWIKFNPALGGVLNDGTGNLSGHAWGEQLGWIDFDNVSINSSGKFTGTATGPIIGTLTFDCGYCDVRTDWRQAASSSSSAGGASGGGIFHYNSSSTSSNSSFSSSRSSGTSSSNSSSFRQSSSSSSSRNSFSAFHNKLIAGTLTSPEDSTSREAENTLLFDNNSNGETEERFSGGTFFGTGGFFAQNFIGNIRKLFTDAKTLLSDNFYEIKLEAMLLLERLGEAYEKIPQKTILSVGATIAAPIALATQYLIAQTNFMPAASTLYDLWLMFLGAMQGILTSIGIRKRRRYWGVVYDSQTKQPIDPALVELIDETTGKTVRQSITDISGRFGFLDYPGAYRIRASKTHYAFPSRLITGSTDSIYENIYHGGVIVISEESALITPNIPMDPLAFDWNQEAKQKIVKFHPRLEMAAQRGLAFIFWAGFVFTAFNFAFDRSILNGAFLVVYVFLALMRKFIPRQKLFGRLESRLINVVGLALEISLKQLPQITFNQTLTKRGGKFFMMAPKGDYILRVKQNADSGDVILYESDISVGKNGVVNNIIVI